LEKIRSFIAIELPAEITAALEEVSGELKKALGTDRGLSWVKPGNIHLTLKFLGDVDASSVEDISDQLAEAAVGIPPFELALTTIGAFPGTRNPRVLWVGIDVPDVLRDLKENIEDALDELGFEREDRPFRPHLTLCRVKSAPAGRKLGRAADNHPGIPPARFRVESIALVRSQLNPGGAKYTVLKEIHLKQDA
jgi:2'-5' RNA ligase